VNQVAGEFRYVKNVFRKDMIAGTCTIRRIGGGLAQLTICYQSKDGEVWRKSLPVRPNGQHGDPEHAWGLTRSGPGRWQVTPSINLGDDHWHETPTIIDVPEGEEWQS
jgi:hypothetical protein